MDKSLNELTKKVAERRGHLEVKYTHEQISWGSNNLFINPISLKKTLFILYEVQRSLVF